MKSFRSNAKATGVLFLVSDVASIVALLLFQPLLKHADFVTSAGTHTTGILWGAFFEILTALAVAGTAIALYPVLKKQNNSMALGYVILRALEATMILVGLLSVLAVVTLRQDFLTSGANGTTYQAISQALVAVKDWTFIFGPNIILGINATVLGYLLYKSKVVPKTIALLAYIDGPFIFASAIVVLLGVYKQQSPVQAIVALPMLVFEVSFSVRLITKGFNASAVTALQSKK
jgi:Domain of unknown function (DUF4386)